VAQFNFRESQKTAERSIILKYSCNLDKSMKHLIALLFFLFIGLNANSQAALFALIFGDKVATENFNVSLEAGLGSNGVSNLAYDSKRALGLQFGIGFNIKLNESFTITPGAYFLSTRSVLVKDAPVYIGENVQIVDEFAEATLTLSYIDIPVKLAYTFNNSPWSVGVAPQLAINTNSQALYSFSREELRADVEDVAESIELGSQFFVARSFQLSGKKILILGLRYYQGFTSALRSDFTNSNQGSRNNYFGLSASFPFIADSAEQ
jgi:hypothetical protein